MRYVNGTIGLARRFGLRNPIRKWRIRRTQRDLLRADFDPNTEGLIIILTPGIDVINGGILSIASIFEETRKLIDLHHCETVLCTVPGEPLLLRYTKFKNDNDLFEFSAVLRYFPRLKTLLIHIPEYCIESFLLDLSQEDHKNLRRIGDLHINIVLQNIRLLPDKTYLKGLAGIGRLTCTTAHARYSTMETRQSLGIPLHKLSVWNSPELYDRIPYSSKQDLMIVSNDPNPHRDEVMRTISAGLPSLDVITIRDMPYEKYRETIAKAKWSLTFGEGLDGYFLETTFSGGISFAVYNCVFFTADFEGLRTVYRSFDDLKAKIRSDIKGLDSEEEFARYQAQQHSLCAKYYNRQQYLENLRLFYSGKYTYP